MKLFLISDNVDTLAGMRMAGIEGVVLHEREKVIDTLEKLIADPEIAIVLLTSKVIELCSDVVYDLKLNSPGQLIVEVPDRHGSGNISETISKYINEAIGVKL